MRVCFAVLLLPAVVFAADPPTNKPTKDAQRWWSHVQVLAADGMEGRDTGSEGYRRAALYVAGQFERAGLKPAGESAYSQPVPLRDLRVDPARSSFELLLDGQSVPLKLNHQIGVTPRVGMPSRSRPNWYLQAMATISPASISRAESS